MKFQLSQNTRESLSHTTGYTYEELTTMPMATFKAKKSSKANRLKTSNMDGKIIPPRGSVLLQNGKVLGIAKVIKDLF